MGIRRDNLFSFSILFSNPEKPFEHSKEVRYKTVNPDDCSNIMAKLRFLTTAQQKKVSGRSTVSSLPPTQSFM